MLTRLPLTTIGLSEKAVASVAMERFMQWVDALGYAASATVLATFCMNAMVPLRILALCSNILFFRYGYFDHLHPVLILHAILFPINVLRLAQDLPSLMRLMRY